MDPFTQRMLERARARREKIDSKLASSGQVVTPRKPLTEKLPAAAQTAAATLKSPERKAIVAPTRRSSKEASGSPAKATARRLSSDAGTKVVVRSPRRSGHDSRRRAGSPGRGDLREVCVTTTEYSGGEERTSDVSVEINIMHRDDVRIEVQVEEQDAPLAVYAHDNLRAIRDGDASAISDKENSSNVAAYSAGSRSALRQNAKSRLDRLGVLYSDKAELSSPIHRTETQFSCATPPRDGATPRPAPAAPAAADGKRKLARLAALADTINNWEDDTTHHKQEAPTTVSSGRGAGWCGEGGRWRQEESTLDVSIHSLRDINRAVEANKNTAVSSNSRTYKKQAPSAPRSPHNLNESTVAALGSPL